MRRILVAAALALATAACGAQQGGADVASVTAASGGPTTGASPTATTDPQEQSRKFAQCMRDHGIDMPDPEAGGGLIPPAAKNADMEKVKKAAVACQEFSPVKERGRLTPEDLDRMRAFTACMRANGVDLPDPDPDGGFGGRTGRIKPNDPAFRKAYEACRSTFPELGRKR
ncbi:hypothetical protein [Nonomuraea cavernae]|uniref:hypothetical protein n=1 Tax=Nonomuraea cavernae TaxID=2045107 RepID=UPI0033FC14BA